MEMKFSTSAETKLEYDNGTVNGTKTESLGTSGQVSYNDDGGGIYSQDSIMTNCVITNNSADNDGGGIVVDGANAKLTWNNTNSYW